MKKKTVDEATKPEIAPLALEVARVRRVRTNVRAGRVVVDRTVCTESCGATCCGSCSGCMT